MSPALDLASILAERERRSLRRSQLAATYDGTVVQLTIAAPGLRKDGEDIREAARYGSDILEATLRERGLRTVHHESRAGETGPCALWVVEAEATSVKDIALGLETGYSLGRLWDFDVYDPKGFKLDREAAGAAARTCFVCGSPAAICAGRRLHESAEVAQRFSELLTRGIEELDEKE